MSVLINGMEMPTHCMDCRFMVSRDDDDCILQSDEANANFEDWDDMKASCPLVPVPPHGRLIDADAELKKLNRICLPDDLSYTIGHDIAKQFLKDAPTIIPASEEGE